MGADENVAIMRRAYEAFNTGDINTLTELFDESAVWHLPGRSSFADPARVAVSRSGGSERWRGRRRCSRTVGVRHPLRLAARSMSSREPPRDLPGSRRRGYDQNSSQA